jgi:hypothetical protein
VEEITLAQGEKRSEGQGREKAAKGWQHIPKAKNNPHKKPCDSPPIPTNHEITPICAALSDSERFHFVSFTLPLLCRPACTVHGGGRCCMRAWASLHSALQQQRQPGSESEGIPSQSSLHAARFVIVMARACIGNGICC